jgi:anaerobic sulfite reductase subunit B
MTEITDTSMVPVPYRVVERRVDTYDTVTLTLRASGAALPAWQSGQFTMVYGFGVGEIPVSISGGEGGELIQHTIRAVGATSKALCDTPVGTTIGLRGPFGYGWPAPPEGVDAVIMCGGIGLAPLRPTILASLERASGRTIVLIGARTPADLLYTDEYDRWRKAGATVLVTVDRGDDGWTDRVGLVTTLLDPAELGDTASSIGYACGPEIMMKFAGLAMVERGIPAEQVWVSLERNMRCGVGLCGHCQLGPVLICRDGPCATFEQAEPFFAIKEL